MIQELIVQLPPSLQPYVVPTAIAATVGGAMFWVCGSRLSQSVVALIGVAVGGLIGLNLPRWFGWSIDAMGTVVGGAIVLGLTGFLLYRWVEAVLLGVIFATVGGVLLWIASGRPTGGASVDWTQALGHLNDPRGFVSILWQGAVSAVPRGVAVGAIAGFIGGVGLSLLWPRVMGVFTTSIVGVTLFLTGGVATLELSRIGWHAQLPESLAARLAGPLVLIMLGVLAQWRVFPPAKEVDLAEEPPQPSTDSEVEASQVPLAAAPINPATTSTRPASRSVAK